MATTLKATLIDTLQDFPGICENLKMLPEKSFRGNMQLSMLIFDNVICALSKKDFKKLLKNSAFEEFCRTKIKDDPKCLFTKSN